MMPYSRRPAPLTPAVNSPCFQPRLSSRSSGRWRRSGGAGGEADLDVAPLGLVVRRLVTGSEPRLDGTAVVWRIPSVIRQAGICTENQAKTPSSWAGRSAQAWQLDQNREARIRQVKVKVGLEIARRTPGVITGRFLDDRAIWRRAISSRGPSARGEDRPAPVAWTSNRPPRRLLFPSEEVWATRCAQGVEPREALRTRRPPRSKPVS
jgi:hypothetical protein